ncbi:hypothetical protein EDB84DRAFT_1620135 [Lactarius hengduanensis]|nr:hypothetical protein EDB84DRAFT_1620135 [Lactarius hengduanensis]
MTFSASVAAFLSLSSSSLQLCWFSFLPARPSKREQRARAHPDIPEEVPRMEQELKESEPEVSPHVLFPLCRCFGIILLPIVSFSADATIVITYVIRQSVHAHRYGRPVPALLDAIRDAPRLVDNKPMSMLFDLFEITLLVGAYFLLSHVMADAKTNWAEDAIFIAFCTMVGPSAWYFTG